MSGGSEPKISPWSVDAVEREGGWVFPATSEVHSGTCGVSGDAGSKYFETSRPGTSGTLSSGSSSCNRENGEAKSWYRNSSGRGGMTCDDGRSRSGGRAEELVPASRSGTCKAATGSGSGDSKVSGPSTSELLRSGPWDRSGEPVSETFKTCESGTSEPSKFGISSDREGGETRS